MIKDGVIYKKSYAPLKVDDGGQADSSYPLETNDCTVRAVAIALGIPYDVAHEKLAKAGRINRRGFVFIYYASFTTDIEPITNLNRYAKRQSYWGEGETIVHIPGQTTVGKFIEKFPKGRYIIKVEKHVLAVIDGVCHDTGLIGKRKIIHSAWKVKETG